MFPVFRLLVLLFNISSSSSSSSFPPPLTYACHPAKASECKKHPFVPGHSLLGLGFNVVTLKRTGAYNIDIHSYLDQEQTCTLCSNPHRKNAKQKLPRAIQDWRPYTSCSKKVTSESTRSSLSMAQEASSGVQNDWKAGLELQHHAGNAKLVLAGSQSEVTKFTEGKSNQDRYSFLRHQLRCLYYSLRLTYEPPLSRQFKKHIRELPQSYQANTREKFYRFIEAFGTHYISHADVGGQATEVTAIRTCRATMDGLSLDELKDCLSVEASASVTGKVEANAEAKACKEMSQKATHGEGFHRTFNEREWQISGGKASYSLLSFDENNSGGSTAFEEWMESLKTHPEIVTYSLEPIHNLVRGKGPQRENLRDSVSDYIMEKALRKNCSCPGSSHPNQGAECSCVCNQSSDRNANCCPTRRGIAKLVVNVNKASGLWGDYSSKTDAFVKMIFGGKETVTPTVWNSDNPTWNERFDLGVVELNSASQITIEVWDEDNKYDDDRLGSCKKPLTSGQSTEVCYCDNGRLDYALSVTCVPHLTGPSCRDYAPSKE
ncbi:hypothetical protein GDO86_019292 [Hymenochirus boettgeri]|uniref:Perforin-1-like n=1 Tax=Hymenochirus boettgeri TaxID=247094 RepID=A0A8T2IJ66_9PIPI|nr:hypothetical protein GDO86_019292 [Hymenochirus boettgeri]